MKNPKNLIELIEGGYVIIAKLPEENNISLEKIKSLDAYTVPLIAHDYGAKTPIMWNSLYKKLGLNIKNIMLVADPIKNGKIIINTLKLDPKYLGGGFGVGWKERLNLIDKLEPEELSSINIVVKKGKNLIGYNTDAEGFIKSLEEKFYEIRKKIKGSKVILLGAGGVSKELAKLIAERGAKRISILNRSYEKAVDLAQELNKKYEQIATGDDESMIRGKILNSYNIPDVIINLTDKGSDGTLVDYSAFHMANPNATDLEIDKGNNLSASRTIMRELKKINPEIIIADIVLPKNPPSKTLAIAENEGLKNLVDGLGMVIYQAVPAYLKIQEANLDKHKKEISEKQVLKIFKKATSFKYK